MQFLTTITLLLCVYTVLGKPCCEHNGNTSPCMKCIVSSSNYNANIILLASHGGSKSPDGMTDRPDRGCYDSATGTCTYTLNCTTDDASKCSVTKTGDSKTIQLSRRMYDKIRQLLGSYPSRLYSRVKRSILDVNREVDEGTFGNSLAVSLYNIYHAKIQEWVNKCETEGRNCIVIDLHGYVSTHTNITQLGVRLSRSELEMDDTDIQALVNESSIRRLSGYSGSMFPSFLRGENSLGRYMQNQSLDTVPSPTVTEPGTGYTYFGATLSPITGRYATDSSDVYQAECHSSNRLSTPARNIFGDRFATALVHFHNEYYVSGAGAQAAGEAAKQQPQKVNKGREKKLRI